MNTEPKNIQEEEQEQLILTANQINAYWQIDPYHLSEGTVLPLDGHTAVLVSISDQYIFEYSELDDFETATSNVEFFQQEAKEQEQ